MELPGGRPMMLGNGVLAEPASGGDRFLLWLPGAQANGFRHWDRVGTAASATVTSSEGIGSLAAILTPARQRIGIDVSALLRRLAKRQTEPSWTLPCGGSCERSGPRRTDLRLVWTEDETSSLDEARIRERWPALQEIRVIGQNLYLVIGVVPDQARIEAATAATDLPPLMPSLQIANHALQEARQAGNRSGEVTALIDLAVAHLHNREAQPAASLLEEAIHGARRLGDRARELDATINLAQAALMLGRPEQASAMLGPAIGYAREVGDRYAEKVALEHLGFAQQGRADHAGALDHFEQARAIARGLGDSQHEAMLLWYAGIAHAELGRPDRAIACGEEAVELLRRLGKPQAEPYAQHLAGYRSGNASTAPALSEGGVFDASVITTNPRPQAPSTTGPGLLRMALTATKAAATFAGSGFKTVPLEIYRARLATCTPCDMFTGVRCRVCGCICAAKARLPHEDCPAGKWPS